MKKIITGFLVILTISCSSEQDGAVSLDDLPVITPELIVEIEQAGENYFSHLGYTSKVLEDSTVLLPDRDLASIFKITADGRFLNVAASEGRGPGEILDPLFLSSGLNNSVLVYDRMSKKVLRFNSNGEFEDEFVMPDWEKGQLSEIYEVNEQYFLTISRSFDYLSNMDLEPEAFVVIFDKESEEYTQDFRIDDKLYARLIVDNRPMGGRVVPFSGENLRAFRGPEFGFFIFWSMGDEIAQLSVSLDTVNTIPFDLPKEELSSEEISEIREDTRTEQWSTLQRALPDYKAVADDFKMDDKNNFWLKLNYRSEFQQWLVMNQEGEKLGIVQIPKDAMLTHISEHHLGVRLESHLFGLYEPVEF